MKKYIPSRKFDSFRDISNDIDLEPSPSMANLRPVAPLEVEGKPPPPAPAAHRADNLKQQVKEVCSKSWFPWAAIGLLYVLSAVTLGLAIWAVSESSNNADQINKVQSQVGITSPEGFSTAVGGSSPDVVLLKSPKSPEGYTFAGSLYRGSGYWATRPSIALGLPRSAFQAVANGTDVYLIGGLNSSESSVVYLDRNIVFDSVLGIYKAAPDMPEPRALLAAALDGDKLYVIGGYRNLSQQSNHGTAAPDMLVYDAPTRTWGSVQGPRVPRGCACAAAVNGKVYVAGGFTENFAPVDTIEVYDPENQSWSKVQKLPSGRGFLSCAAANGKLYISGGASQYKAQDSDAFADMFSFNPEDSSLTSLAAMSAPRFRHVMVVVPDEDRGALTLVAVGGQRTVPYYNDDYMVGVNSVEQYLPAFDTWILKAPMDNPRYGHAAASLPTGLHVFGGADSCEMALVRCRALQSVEVLYSADVPEVFVHLQQDVNSPKSSSDVILSSRHGDEALVGSDGSSFRAVGSLYQGEGYWSRIHDMPMGHLSDLQVVGVPNGTVLFITGGSDTTNNVTNGTWTYDTVRRVYARRADMPEPRYRHAAEIIGDKMYVVGGLSSPDGGASETTLVYDISNDVWSVSSASAILNVPRSDACMTAVGGRLYLAGGYSDGFNETLSSVEMFDPDADEWYLETPMPTPRGDVMCTTVDGRLVVVGGYWDPTGQGAANSFRNEVEAYNVKAREWKSLAPMPHARGDQAIVELPNNRFMVMGGETTDPFHTHTQVGSNEVMEYIAAQDLWVMKAPMIEQRFRFDAGYAGDTVFVFGGDLSFVAELSEETGEDRGLDTVEAFYYTQNPDVFVYMKE